MDTTGRFIISESQFLSKINFFRWDNQKGAENICKQLGYSGGVKYTAGEGTGTIATGNRRCSGGEETIFHCPLRRAELEGCTHAIDQGVDCSDG